MEKFGDKSNIIERGKKYVEKKKAEGCVRTEWGWLSQDDIQEAGFKYDPTTGVCRVPVQEYIAEQDGAGRKKGQKYIGVAQSFLKWKKKRDGNISQEEKTDQQFMDDGFNIDNINF